MKTVYSPELKAHLSFDDKKKVRHVRHSQEYWPSKQDIPRLSAHEYLKEMAETLRIPVEELKNLHKKVSYLDPREQGVEYHLGEEKHLFDSVTIGYYQTYMNVPVWRRGLSVKIKQNPNRVVGSTNNSEDDLHGKLPAAEAIERYKKIFQQATARRALLDAGLKEEAGEDRAASFVRSVLNLEAPPTTARLKEGRAARVADETRLLSGKFFIYKYDPKKRYAGRPSPPEGKIEGEISAEDREMPIPKLPPVSDKIKTSRAYLVAEIVFISNLGGFGGISWLILVEIETGSILYIECMTCGVNGLVFRRDPMVKTGNLTITADDGNAVLNPQQDNELLTDLDAPLAGTQHLRGTYVDIQELTIAHADPDVAPPTEPSGTDFDSSPKYDARTDDFGAVNAYYHLTELFKTIENLGFPRGTYFDGTKFPIPVDHRALGNDINAHWSPNGTGGTDHLCFALCDLTNTANPLLRAVDPWVHWHEMGGHGTLGDHVGSGNLGFAHSAGDGLAALQMDPESQLRALGLPERFRYAPFRPFVDERRFDRGVSEWSVASITLTNGGSGYTSLPTVTIVGGGGTGALADVPPWGVNGGHVTAVRILNPGTGYTSAPSVVFTGGGGTGAAATTTIGTWAWGGGMDQGGYRSEQILATCHFRIYRSLGGDHDDLGRRQFASRMVTYLILRTIGHLTSGTNPSNWDPTAMANVPGRGAQLWCEEMQDIDAEDWTTEGLSGGAYNKVIRWAFEKQGSYQPAGAPTPVTTAGAPPDVDVYIDDGRAGEYQFQAVHWENMSIWNRNAADGLTGHQNAIDGQTNYLYGKVKNRGTSAANNVTVRAFHSLPGAGLTWPNDFVEMSPVGGLPIASIAANNAAEVTVGPFEWEPNINAYGHDCVLMIASVAGDPSNIDNFTATETIQEWRLVPNDNNVGQRNVSVLPGEGGGEALMASLDGAFFVAGNNLNKRAVMELRVDMPGVLAKKGWQLQFDGISDHRFPLKAGEKRRIRLKLKKGAEFTKADIEGSADRMIKVSLLANGLLLGGMSYYVDPDLKKPSGGKRLPGKDCGDTAQKLLDCLKVSGDRRVKKVRVKKVSLDIELDDDCCCD